MCLFRYDDDPEPEEPRPAGPLYVPVRPGARATAVRVFHTPLGDRTAVGFTSAERLTATLGTAQPWIRLSEAVLRALAGPLGVDKLTVDPVLTAPSVGSLQDSAPSSRKPQRPSGRENERPARTA
ncbi:SAV_915 family protein [Streptomyces sp. NPDC055103]